MNTFQLWPETPGQGMGKVTSMKQPQVLSACDVDPCRSNILPLPALLPDLLKEEVSPRCQHVSTAIGWLLTFLFNKESRLQVRRLQEKTVSLEYNHHLGCVVYFYN